MISANNNDDPVIVLDDDDDDDLTDREELDTTITLDNNNKFNHDDYDEEAASTTVGADDPDEVIERERFIQSFQQPQQQPNRQEPVLFVGEPSSIFNVKSSSVQNNSTTLLNNNNRDDDDELVGTTLKFYQRADTTFPSFKNALARKTNFSIPYVKQPLDIDEEDALLTAEVIPLITAELNTRSSSIRQLEKPIVKKIDNSKSTFTDIEATKLFSLNLGMEKAFKTRCNDSEFEEEFSKIFFSVYGSDAKRIFELVGGIIEADMSKDKNFN